MCPGLVGAPVQPTIAPLELHAVNIFASAVARLDAVRVAPRPDRSFLGRLSVCRACKHRHKQSHRNQQKYAPHRATPFSSGAGRREQLRPCNVTSHKVSRAGSAKCSIYGERILRSSSESPCGSEEPVARSPQTPLLSRWNIPAAQTTDAIKRTSPVWSISSCSTTGARPATSKPLRS